MNENLDQIIGFGRLNIPTEVAQPNQGSLTRVSSTLDKDQGSDAVFERTARDFWENTIYTTWMSTFGDSYITIPTGGGVTTGTAPRIRDISNVIDASHDIFARVGINYTNGVDTNLAGTTAYIAPIVSEHEFNDSNGDITLAGRAYTGVKIVDGIVSLVSRDYTGSELLVPTNIDLANEYAVVFEFRISGNECQVLFNDKPIGSIKSFVKGKWTFQSQSSFGMTYTLFVNLLNNSSTNYYMVLTTYQFMYSRK